MERKERIEALKSLRDERTSYEVIPGRYDTSEECPARSEEEIQALTETIAEAELMEKVESGRVVKKSFNVGEYYPATGEDKYVCGFNEAIDLCNADFAMRLSKENLLRIMTSIIPISGNYQFVLLTGKQFELFAQALLTHLTEKQK